jgi:hypothetical protein
MTPEQFTAKWRNVRLTERQTAQEHFLDLCRLLGEPTPVETDPTGESFCFEKGASKTGGGEGWADVWKRGHFGWEYKRRKASLDTALDQLKRYALALENPPLLIVSDTDQIRIHTNWTNAVSVTHTIDLDDLEDARYRERLKFAFSDPERLRPGQTRREVTEAVAGDFAELARELRAAGHEPQAVAHFLNRLVFCMFAENVGLLPGDMFKKMLKAADYRAPQFEGMARSLFGAMKDGGLVGFEQVAQFNGGLFDDDSALPLTREQIRKLRQIADRDWSEIDPSILGTLFERGLDPDKRSQLGAHYTDRDKIILIVDPVVARPWHAEWEAVRAEIGADLDKAASARSPAARKVNVAEAAAASERYLRLRDELWFRGRDWLADGTAVLPRDNALKAELVAVRYAIEPSGKVKVASKDQMRARGLRSPDLADAFLLTFAGGEHRQPPAPGASAYARRRLTGTWMSA